MSVLAVYSIKGGVGKTAAAVNLAYLASLHSSRTLIIDLDPQGSASYYFGKKPSKKLNSEKLVKGGKKTEKHIESTAFERLDILPSNLSLRNMDIALDDAKHSKRRLGSLVKHHAESYAHIFLDTPPNINLESENVFRAADYLLVPLIPSPLSLHSFHKLLRFFDENALKKKKLLPFFSLADRRKKIHRETLEIRDISGIPLLSTSIPYSSLVEKMGERRNPLPAFSRNSKASLAFSALWEEIKKRID
jgi:chromosome partitioning protein